MGLLDLLNFFRRNKNEICKYARKMEFGRESNCIEFECVSPKDYSCEYKRRAGYLEYICTNKKHNKR